ncbi:hypothetical protein BD626DRAFT_425713 [Schizophyllum amplum]|uniref:Uncharacterized protein n=1 Tax=Schizophyllum amplum TaxID=97359 RepID=A0A550CV54_9AGAR|nr:hypothetical protein BD626DRAFT_425713 [Auriculariopsis ampla]
MAAPSAAGPLKVPSSGIGEPSTPSKPKLAALANGAAVPDISSPHELTAFVETLLEQLDTRFEEMSNEILDRSSASPAARVLPVLAPLTHPGPNEINGPGVGPRRRVGQWKHYLVHE